MIWFQGGLVIGYGIEKEGREKVIPAEQLFDPFITAAQAVKQGKNILDGVALEAGQVETLVNWF